VTQPVVSSNPPFIQINVTLEGESQPIYVGEALLDTGYDGSLSLPLDILQSRTAKGEWEIELADGSRLSVPFFYGTIDISGLARVGIVLSALGTEAIVGRRVMDYFRVTFDHGREVIVEP
jgi:predicted aspartyl protease